MALARRVSGSDSTDGSGWGDSDRLYGSAASSESAALHDIREEFTAVKVAEQSGLDAALRSHLALTEWPGRTVALQVTNRQPGTFSEYDLGDALTVSLPTYGFGGVRGLFKVTAREFFPDEDVCDLVVEEVI